VPPHKNEHFDSFLPRQFDNDYWGHQIENAIKWENLPFFGERSLSVQ
jgi:hypothetical protein